MASINDTVLVLSGDLATSANKLNAAVTDINAFFLGANPPEALATQMTNNVGTLAPVAGAAAVQATIGTFATDFGNLAGYSGTPLADYRADVLAVRWEGAQQHQSSAFRHWHADAEVQGEVTGNEIRTWPQCVDVLLSSWC
jgi:hypothetical protein